MGNEPGESMEPRASRDSRELARPPSTRYQDVASNPAEPGGRASPIGPLARATTVAVAGAAALVGVGAILASTAGLLFVSGLTGACVGLVLARARVPDHGRMAALSPRGVSWLAVALALGAVLLAGVATWLIARDEGGTLGMLDYLLTTFGPFVPGEAIVAALAAVWGAAAGPIQR